MCIKSLRCDPNLFLAGLSIAYTLLRVSFFIPLIKLSALAKTPSCRKALKLGHWCHLLTSQLPASRSPRRSANIAMPPADGGYQIGLSALYNYQLPRHLLGGAVSNERWFSYTLGLGSVRPKDSSCRNTRKVLKLRSF